MNQSLYSSLPKVLLFTCFLLFFEANAQVNTFETVANEINIPTQPYSSIKKGADSLFAYWHAQNPNDTGLAPGEKKFIRWNALAQSRGHIAGDNTTSVSGIQSTMTNNYGSIPYCSTGLVNHEWQLIGPNPEPGDKMVYGIANTIAVHPTNSNIICKASAEVGLKLVFFNGDFKSNQRVSQHFSPTSADALHTTKKHLQMEVLFFKNKK